MHISAIERRVLNIIQQDIPLESEPFKIMSRKAGIKEDKFLQYIKRLRGKGIIRNFSAGINHRRLGFISSLIALKIPPHRLQAIVKKVVRYDEITHCFLREGEYNLWIVFLSLDKGKLKIFLNRLSKEIGKKNILNLPTKKQFKLKTRLKI